MSLSDDAFKRKFEPLKMDGSSSHKTPRLRERKVRFAEVAIETIHYIDPSYTVTDNDGDFTTTVLPTSTSAHLTEEITVLSSLHGQARRYLRDIDKADLQTAIKYGVKTKGHKDPTTGLPRWKYTFGNVVYITDYTCREEVTSYKQAVTIQPAIITQEMRDRRNQVKRILNEEPQMCSTHSIVIIDQSGSMRTSDVNGFRNRSQAAYGCLALDYVADQLYQDPTSGVNSFTLIEMNDTGTVVYDREPLDWLLFNELLQRQQSSKPRSHGNYASSIRLAADHIIREKEKFGDIDHEDLPHFALVILSDGKPSDKEQEQCQERIMLMYKLAQFLKGKLNVCCMGLGASGSDFVEMEKLVTAAKMCGANADFTHAGLSAVQLSSGFSSLSSRMTTLRDEVDHINDTKDDDREVVKLRNRSSLAKSKEDCNHMLVDVKRFKFDERKWKDYEDEWVEIPLIHKDAAGFQQDKIPFGKGAERLAFRFQEIDRNGKLLGKMMVAKESKRFISDEYKKFKFHMNFCRIQLKAAELASLFNRAVKRVPALQPVEKYESLPTIQFVKCRVYTWLDGNCTRGVLVENFLKGKFIKFNGNNGFVSTQGNDGDRTVELESGNVYFTDFLHAFSHWSYVHSDNAIILCDLQGVLNAEGRHPRFDLTDSAICSRKRKEYGKTDIGLRGVRQFFRKHRCNNVCRGLGLASS